CTRGCDSTGPRCPDRKHAVCIDHSSSTGRRSPERWSPPISSISRWASKSALQRKSAPSSSP
ncbi:MAG: hypothetical protein ACK53Y_13360, partial [bacterium]